jgi:hypothetical protein
MRRFLRLAAGFAGLLLLALPVRAAELSVASVAPARHTLAPRTTTLAVVFDRAVDPASVGAGSFQTGQVITVGSEPHGVGVLDVDGDGDTDVVATNHGSNNLALAINDGSGVFGAASFFEGGVTGEYGLAVGDANEDGLLDLVVAGREGEHLRAVFANGDGSFSPAAAAHSSGGRA